VSLLQRPPGKQRIVASKVMTEQQFTAAQEELISRLQSMREAECGARSLIPKAAGSDDSNDNLDDVYEPPVSSEHQAAQNEWIQYCRIVKPSRKFPKKYKLEGLITVGEIQLGIVEEPGQDLEASYPFKKCNLADFIDATGYFDLVKFLGFNQKSFPYLYKLACCLAALRTNEVGCERFFSIAGYVSNPRRTRLKVRHYESIAMLKRNMQQVYIDEDWVVKQYMQLEQAKAWASIDTVNDLRVAALEQELHADDLGVPVESLPGEDGAGVQLQLGSNEEPIPVDDGGSDDDTDIDDGT
jgi:hypothetical protein